VFDTVSKLRFFLEGMSPVTEKKKKKKESGRLCHDQTKSGTGQERGREGRGRAFDHSGKKKETRGEEIWFFWGKILFFSQKKTVTVQKES